MFVGCVGVLLGSFALSGGVGLRRRAPPKTKQHRFPAVFVCLVLFVLGACVFVCLASCVFGCLVVLGVLKLATALFTC